MFWCMAACKCLLDGWLTGWVLAMLFLHPVRVGGCGGGGCVCVCVCVCFESVGVGVGVCGSGRWWCVWGGGEGERAKER